MAQIQYGYPGGNPTLTTASPSVSAAAARSVPPMADLSQLAAALMARKDAEARQAAAEEAAAQEERMGALQAAAFRRSAPPATGGGPVAAPAQKARYVKLIQGFNMTPGYVPAQEWEPGAIAAGYGESAPVPNNAMMQPSGPSRASLSDADEAVTSPRSRRREDEGNPYATGPGVTSGNPWATGPGVVGGRYY